MLYDEKMKKAILDTLENRVSSIANSIQGLSSQGYLPNKNKINKLGWSMILIDAYENVDIFTKEQQANLDNIFNKVIKL